MHAPPIRPYVVEELDELRCKPRLCDDETCKGLDETEAYVAALVRDGFSMQAIIEMCPMSEEASVRILAKLVTDGVVTFDHRSV